ncbi:MAG: hypothetical protein ABUL72_02970, partial [Armatimonadota bacterium]
MSAECQIGIDFADDKIRLVRIRREGTEAIEAASELRLPGYLNNDGIIDDERGVINALRKLSGTYGAKAGQSVFSVPNDKSNFTWLRFGELEGREMRDAARFKVRRSDQEPQDVAVAIAELETDDKLVVGAPTALVKQRKEVLNRAGYDVVGAETQAQSVLRSVAIAHNIDSNLLSTTTVTIAHLTEGRTHIIVLQGGRLNFVRTTRIGYSGILAKAAEALALTIDQVGPVVFSQTCKINEKYVADVSLGDHEYAVDVSEPMDAFAKEFRRV